MSVLSDENACYVDISGDNKEINYMGISFWISFTIVYDAKNYKMGFHNVSNYTLKESSSE